jgi:hypothetical protein
LRRAGSNNEDREGALAEFGEGKTSEMTL